MPIKEQTGIRPLESVEDFCETRLEAIGFIFHGNPHAAKSKGQPSGTSNLLHFARCPSWRRLARARPRSGFGACGSLTSISTSLSAPSVGSGASCASGKSPSACSTSLDSPSRSQLGGTVEADRMARRNRRMGMSARHRARDAAATRDRGFSREELPQLQRAESSADDRRRGCLEDCENHARRR